LSDSPEFDSWRWIDFQEPKEQIIFFKRQVYIQALNELEPFLKQKRTRYLGKHRRSNKS
jgi:putative (di)nucleoside polyphosphate hydrolase